MMIDYISRHAAIIEMMDNDVDHAQGMDGREVVQILSDIPAADVVPVVHGEWVSALDGNDMHVRCDKCFKIYDWVREAQYFNFCPNCGAKMDGGDEHE